MTGFSAAFLIASTCQAWPAEALTLTGELSASLSGIPVATAEFKAVRDGEQYEVSGFGRASGLTRIVTSGHARVESRGRMSPGAVAPTAYRHELVKKAKSDRVRIAFTENRVHNVSVEPPTKARRDRVPLAEEHFRQVLDPLSAVMLLSSGEPAPDLCNRTLPVFDGEARYDLELSFKRMDRVRGVASPAYVCAIRYRPIAGHRPDRSSVKFLQSNKGMEIWLASIGGKVVAPVRVQVPTPLGSLVLSATRLSLR